MLERFFKLKEHNTTVKTEILAGITTFVTMAYILVVNPGILSGWDVGSPVFNGVFFATAISAFIGTFLMGVYAKLPFALASGMGLNTFFAVTVMGNMGYTYSQALAIVFLSGILFIAITVIGAREAIVKAIPHNIKIAISGGIGLFLALIGLGSSGGCGLVTPQFTLVDFTQIKNPEMKTQIIGVILAMLGLIVITVLYKLNVKGSIIIGIAATTIAGIPFGITKLPETFTVNIGAQFKDFTDVSFMAFTQGFSELFAGQGIVAALGTMALLVISFSLVDMFDTLGTLLGTAKKADLLDDNGDMPRMKEALMADAVATVAGAVLGTSTVTTYVESAAGIGEGGRTGLTSVTTSILFLIALIFAPVVGIIPAVATAPALIFVGILMMSSIKEVDFSDISEAVPAFLTIALMPFTSSIANGIAFGIISHTAIKLFTGKVKEINWIAALLTVIFLIRYLFMAA